MIAPDFLRAPTTAGIAAALIEGARRRLPGLRPGTDATRKQNNRYN